MPADGPRCGSIVTAGALSMTLIAASAPAQGGPPLVTEDPGTPGAGRWEINLAGEGEEVASDRLLAAPVLDLNYGWGDRVQLKLEVPWVVSDPQMGKTRDGLGLWELGIKWRFLDRGPGGVQLSVYPQIELEGPGTNEAVAGDSSALALPLQAARAFGRLEMSAEVGYLVTEHERDKWFAGLATGVAMRPGLEVVGEVYGSRAEGPERRLTAFNLGFRLELADRLMLLAAAGRAFGSGGPDLTIYLGVQILQ